MKIGIGLPARDPSALIDWAQEIDAGPFSSLGMLDRIVYFNPDSLITLAAMAGATKRVRLQTEVLLAPLRNTGILAKEIASLDQISRGRFVLGMGVGNYRGPMFDDYHVAGVDRHTRGRRLDEQVAEMRRIWAGEPYDEKTGPIGPQPATPGGPEILFGGFRSPALKRVARWKAGFFAAGPPNYMNLLIKEVRQYWDEAGHDGGPRIVAHCYVALGDAALVNEARETLIGYYSYLDDADQIPQYMATSPDMLRNLVAVYEALGVDEVVCYCWARDQGQISRIQEALAGLISIPSSNDGVAT